MMNCSHPESSQGHYADINEGGDTRCEDGGACNGKVCIPSSMKTSQMVKRTGRNKYRYPNIMIL
jgi:hypothetical protein